MGGNRGASQTPPQRRARLVNLTVNSNRNQPELVGVGTAGLMASPPPETFRINQNLGNAVSLPRDRKRYNSTDSLVPPRRRRSLMTVKVRPSRTITHKRAGPPEIIVAGGTITCTPHSRTCIRNDFRHPCYFWRKNTVYSIN